MINKARRRVRRGLIMSKARRRVLMRSKARRCVRRVTMMGKARRRMLMRSKARRYAGAQARKTRNNGG